MKRKRLLFLLALLMTAATGAWAKVAGTVTVTVTHSDQSVSNYGSLADVFALSGDENANLQDGDVVTLLDDQTGLTESLTLYGKKITFDLNGHRVSSSERVFNLTGSADLTLTSSQEGGTVNATFADTEVNHYAIRVGEGCKLTIPESSKHFTISSNNTCIFDNGKVVIAGSPTISGTKGGFYSVEATQPFELTISGSPTITSDGYGFFVLSPSCQLTISGAPTISGKVNGIFAYCPVTISGQPKISSQGAAGQMGAIVPYDIMAYQLTIGGKAEHPATLDFTGTKATGNIILYYPISITGPVALGSADKWNVTIMDSEGFPTTGTFTSGWTTNMTDAAIADYFTGGQLSDGTNLIVTTDADGEGALAPTYSVSLNDGTLNPTTWTAKAGEATTFSALPLKGVTEGQPVTLTYGGRLKVKSVTATTDAKPATYLKWDATKKKLVEAEIPAKATPVENADGNVTWVAGTYLVEGNVTINGSVKLKGDVELIIKDGAKLTAKQVYASNNISLNIYGQSNGSGELNVVCSSGNAISTMSELNIHGCKVIASSSSTGNGGIGAIGTLNVYDGSVDAKNTYIGYGIYINQNGSLNIYGGQVKAEGKGTTTKSYGITGSSGVTVTVYDGKLWAGCADKAAFKSSVITLTKDASYTNGKIETSADGEIWTVYNGSGTPDAKYVRVGY